MIPIFDLREEYKDIGKELRAAFHAVATRGQFILGKEVSLFESAFSKSVHCRFGVGVASGTDALTLGLKSLGIQERSEVIIPANAYPTAFGVAMTGATIRLVDVQSDGTIDPRKLKETITPKTQAVIAVHLYGNGANLSQVRSGIPQKILLIEDAAQAHGTMIDGKKAGSIGDIGCFSFYPSKNLGALGDGGMVVTNNQKAADRLKQLRIYGEKKRYDSHMIAGVSRLDELQAAFLRIKLKHMKSWIAKRRTIAKAYTKAFENLGDIEVITRDSSYSKSSCHLFVIKTQFRNTLHTFLQAHDIGSLVHYPTPIHLVQSFKNLGYKKGDFPMTEDHSSQVLSLPLFPQLTDGQIEKVIHTVRMFFQNHS
jgi:dTDP-4-amino-4,6-dideoxygalactose transaminase